MKTTIFPPPLKPGATIGVVSPASSPLEERLLLGINYLEKNGFSVVSGEHVLDKFDYLAGEDQDRIDDLNRMIRNPDIDAIISSRGGYGCARILDQIDYDALRKKPKIIVGYSDITLIQLAVLKKTGLVSYSGPMVAVEMGKGIDPFTEKHFWDMMTTTKPLTLEAVNAEVIHPGKASGCLIGGCLALVNNMLATPFMPALEGAILILEDIGESIYKIDRYLAQLKLGGILANLNGLIIGDFMDIDETDSVFTVEQIVRHYTADLKIPVILNFPYGHGDLKFTLPIGCKVELDTNKKHLKMLEHGEWYV